MLLFPCILDKGGLFAMFWLFSQFSKLNCYGIRLFPTCTLLSPLLLLWTAVEICPDAKLFVAAKLLLLKIMFCWEFVVDLAPTEVVGGFELDTEVVTVDCVTSLLGMLEFLYFG